MGSRNKRVYQNSDLYRLIFLFVENCSNLTGLLTHILPTQKCIVFFIFAVYLTLDLTDRKGLPLGGGALKPPSRVFTIVYIT